MPRSRSPRPGSSRRGVTLVEMLIAVTLLVLIMTIVVQVFLAATSTLSAARTYQELDSSLRQLDATLRLDLQNLTAPLTPPLDPNQNKGYFEYGENEFADLQSEDADDYLKFTVRAAEGHFFTGRMLAAPATAAYYNPITITSRYAEVIYFLRNGNLYRRVRLVAPDQKPDTSGAFYTVTSFFGAVGASWQGLNDISARPAETLNSTTATTPIVLNTLGDLTNRENRFASPRFVNDFTLTGDAATNTPDGVADDTNGDGIPDFWPSLYPGAATAGLVNIPSGVYPPPSWSTYGTSTLMAFPYIYGFAYSNPEVLSAGVGWIHTPEPTLFSSKVSSLGWLACQQRINHGPLEFGDSLPAPSTNSGTWWGFPTWRETLHPTWNDPYVTLGTAGQPNGLTPRSPTDLPAGSATAIGNFLPPMTEFPPASWGTSTWTRPLRVSPQLYTDGVGASTFALTTSTTLPQDYRWTQLWEDDLVMTGVRSFDVKAYDDAYGGYVDLGWGDDLRLYTPYDVTGSQVVDPTYYPASSAPKVNLASATPPLLGSYGSSTLIGSASGTISPFYPSPAFTWPPTAGGKVWSLYGGTLAHEGRMPPLVGDGRVDPQALNGGIVTNLGDDVAGAVTRRLRRVYDTWSTDYTQAPSRGLDPTNGGAPFGLGIGAQSPAYPSYPPPYPVKLRGLQIKIRVVDPRNERVKDLTIHQSFD